MDIKESDVLGPDVGEHWYYRSKSAAVRRLLRGHGFTRIVDIGAGSGFFSRELLRHSQAESAVCIDPNYERERDEIDCGRPILFRRTNSDSPKADLLLLMDVLEHVDDDRALLRESMAGAVPGALVLISVPAFRFMWSAHDEFLGHRRRYTLAEVESLVEGVGLERLKTCYFFGAALPLAFLARKLAYRRHGARSGSDLQRHSRLVNSAMAALCACELPFLKVNRLAGLTVFCLARIPQIINRS